MKSIISAAVAAAAAMGAANAVVVPREPAVPMPRLRRSVFGTKNKAGKKLARMAEESRLTINYTGEYGRNLKAHFDKPRKGRAT